MMNQEDIFKKIGQILNELNDQYQYLAQNPRELNDLEMDLFLANASFLSDHVQIIKRMNNTIARKTLPEHTEEIRTVEVVETVTAKPVVEEEIFKIDNAPPTFEFILSESTSIDKFEFEEKSVDEIFDRPLSIEEEEIIARKQKLREKIEYEELEAPVLEEDEIGPEPFLVSESVNTSEDEQVQEIAAEPETVEEEYPEILPEEGLDIQSEEELPPNAPQEIDPEEEPQIEEPFIIQQPEVNEPSIIEQPKVKQAEAYWFPVEDKKVPETKIAPAPVSSVSAEPSTKPATLNDILAGNRTSGSASEGTRMEIKDLKQAISLNDKLRYIKDLFNGYNLAYAEAIDLLNKMPDFKSADSFLQNNYALKNNWASKQDTADQFYELLNRRFPAK